jgi:hypothetical protein
MILSACSESIILSAGGAESMILSRCAKSIILSVPSAERMILSAPPARERTLRVNARACPRAESIILSAGGTESMVLSARAESIILSAGGTASMILSTRAESIILSAPLAENMMLSAPQKHCHQSVCFCTPDLFFFLLSKLSIAPDFHYSFGFS